MKKENLASNPTNLTKSIYKSQKQWYNEDGWKQPDGVKAFSKFGSIDHQSMEDSLYDLIKAIGFETYLFSSDIMVIIDHDNH